MAVVLVESTSVDDLVEKLKASSYRKSEDIKQKSTSRVQSYAAFSDRWPVIESMSLDDDIVAGPSKMSLKCPVSIIIAFAFQSPNDVLVEFHASEYALSVFKMRAFSMLRCNVVVCNDGTNDDVVMSCLRKTIRF